jgi:serine/threonine protein phosphatase 1
MISFFKSLTSFREKETSRPSLPVGLRIYAIGDIHGRLDLLTRLSSKIADDLEARPCENAAIVLLGDYVDRGPQSSGVIEWILTGKLPAPFFALRGNHEATLLNFLEDSSILGDWRRYGGLETLQSYGVDVRHAMRGKGYSQAQADFQQALPSSHLKFYRDTALSWSSGDYFFCHAGVKPGVPLALQLEHDLLWIRDEFNFHRGSFEKIIVHGHTPVGSPESLPNRINVDTGAYATDVLTSVVLEGDERLFISARSVG